MKKITLALLMALATIVVLMPGCGSSAQTEVTSAHAHPQTMPCANTLDPTAEADIDTAQVAFSFVFMGCNRVSTYSQSNASTANVFQLQRSFNEVSTMRIKPKFFFFLGDLVLGLDTVADTLHNELKAWVTQFQSATFSGLPNSGTRLIALPGNHEMLYMNKIKAPKTSGKASKHKGGKKSKSLKEELPWAGAAAVWRSLMRPFAIQGTDKYGLNYAPGDSLTYSFNYMGTHFVLMNTDTYVPQQPLTPGLAPAAWICSDITTARQNKNTAHVFVMGHKPAYILNSTWAKAEAKDEILDTNVTQQIWPVMAKNQVEAMLSAHAHEFSVLQPKAGTSYQLIAGNGGSQYEKDLPLNNQFFGFTKIYVMKNGQVLARSFGRLTPGSAYTAALPCDTLTRLRYNQYISWGTQSPGFNPDVAVQVPGKGN